MKKYKLIGLVFPWIWALSALAQTSTPPPSPAQMVMIFKAEPKEFKSISLDKQPFASLEIGMDYSTTWPVPPGKHELAVTAPGAEEKRMNLTVSSKDVGLLLVDLLQNPDPAKAGQYPKVISLTWLPMDLPAMDPKVAKIYAYLAPEMKPINGELFHGNTASTKLDLVPGKLNSLGVGKTGLSVGEQQLVFFHPGAAGLYVSVIFAGKDGKLKSVPFSFEMDEP